MTEFFLKQLKYLDYDIDKIISKKRYVEEKPPYTINVKFMKKKLDVKYCLDQIINSLKRFEIVWGYIAIDIKPLNSVVRYHLNLTPMLGRPDYSFTIIVSTNYILGEHDYKSPTKMDTVSKNDDNSCIICLSNCRTCVFYPCGHAKFCWECTDRLFINKRYPRCPECNEYVRETRPFFF